MALYSLSEAASAGISLHCDRHGPCGALFRVARRLPEEAQRPRYMISIEMPWEERLLSGLEVPFLPGLAALGLPDAA